MRSRYRLYFVPRSPLKSVQMPAKQVSGRSPLGAHHTTSFPFKEQRSETFLVRWPTGCEMKNS
jgi:hypothetical protein